MRQYNRIADAILTLESFTERFGVFECEPEYSLGIHRMVVGNYLVCYVIDPAVVTVIAVFYGASDVHRRLQTYLTGVFHDEGYTGKQIA